MKPEDLKPGMIYDYITTSPKTGGPWKITSVDLDHHIAPRVYSETVVEEEKIESYHSVEDVLDNRNPRWPSPDERVKTKLIREDLNPATSRVWAVIYVDDEEIARTCVMSHDKSVVDDFLNGKKCSEIQADDTAAMIRRNNRNSRRKGV